MYRKSLFALIAAVMLCLVTSHAEARGGFYLGLGVAYNTIGGDLDGAHSLVGGTEELILPDLDNALGIDLLLGQVISDTWAVEFNFLRSGHSGTWMGLSGDATYMGFTVNGKYRFLPERRVRPYLLVGVGYNGLTIKQGAADIFTGEVADAKLVGTGLNLGTGIDVYLHPKVSLTLGILYRYIDYTDAKGVHQSARIDEGVNGSGFSFLLSMAYHF